MLQNLSSLINDYWSWAVGLLGLTAALSWIPGGGAVIGIVVSAFRIVASAFEVISPIISGIISAIVWVWKTILLPGLMDILDSWMTILTVAALLGLAWLVFVTRYEIKGIQTERSLARCTAELAKCKKPKLKVPETPDVEYTLPWPFSTFKF